LNLEIYFKLICLFSIQVLGRRANAEAEHGITPVKLNNVAIVEFNGLEGC
jgi:hypothetical protein